MIFVSLISSAFNFNHRGVKNISVALLLVLLALVGKFYSFSFGVFPGTQSSSELIPTIIVVKRVETSLHHRVLTFQIWPLKLAVGTV